MLRYFSILKKWNLHKYLYFFERRNIISDLFEEEYYLNLYPDIAKSDQNPLRHFLNHGGFEGRKPNHVFDSIFYLERNKDVAKAGINPLVHFAQFGWRELRDPSADFDIGWYWLVHMGADFTRGNPVHHYLAEGKARGLPPKPHAPMTAAETREIGIAVQNMLKRPDLSPETCSIVGNILFNRRLWPEAELVYRALADLQWDDADVHERLASILAAQGNWWQQIEELTRAIKLAGGRPDWFYRRGIAEQTMGRWQDAAESYAHALALDPAKADASYRRGFVLEKLGSEGARQCYQQAIALSGDKDAARFGVGALHQARGYWDEAGHAYAQRLKDTPLDAPLHNRLGTAMDRCYRWSDAAKHYRAAIALDPDVPSWHYRLGFVLERMRQWHEAAEAYARAVRLHSEPPAYWTYRAAYVLAQTGAHRAACSTFLDMHPEWRADGDGDGDGAGRASRTSGSPARNTPETAAITIPLMQDALARDQICADRHYALAQQFESAREWMSAAFHYQAALDRSDTHRPPWFFRLGLALTEAGRFQDACQAFAQIRILQRPYGVPETEFDQSPDQKLTTSYVEFSECLPIRQNVILYESFNGNSISCNPLAIFNNVIADPDFSDFLHIWVLNDRNRIPEELRTKPNVIFLRRGSEGYLRHIATAKYLVNNSGFPPYFVRREGQKYLSTWHGTPLKSLGKEQKYKFYDHKRTQRNFLHATHMISPNSFTTDILLNSYDIRPIYSGKFLESGYPRIDLTLNATAADKTALKQRLGIPEGKPVVLYAPTWRGTLDNVRFDTRQLKHDLAALGRQDCHLLFRGHNLLETVLTEGELACEVVPADIDSNILLSIVDILITDYSSILFDFMVTGRPIIYYIHDLEKYQVDRGLYFDMQSMPGYKCRSIEDLCTALSHALSGETLDREHYRASQQRFNHHDDGSATQRVLDFFFRDSEKNILQFSPEDHPRILFHAGSFSPDETTSSFINLVKNIDRKETDIILAIDPAILERSADRIAMFRKLPAGLYIVPRYGNMPMTIEERWLMACQEAHPLSLGDEGRAILANAYQREFVRIFGRSQFDSAVIFRESDSFWPALFFRNRVDFRKITFLHEGMLSKFTHENPEIDGIFGLYEEADCLVSTSDRMRALNRNNISSQFGIDPDKFVYIEDMIDFPTVYRESQQDLDIDLLPFFGGQKTFLTMGRLCVEKDRPKLLRAFQTIAHTHPDARLVIFGDDPLRHEWDMLIESLDLQHHICLAGPERNPFPALKACDCFVLPSHREGPAMALLAAMALHKPIVATDIGSTRDLLAGRGGCLVDHSVEGLTAGMMQFLRGEVLPCEFDAEHYREQALSQFKTVVLGKRDPTNNARGTSHA